MTFKKRIVAVAVSSVLFSGIVQAKTLLVSDIDDTIKVSHVLDLNDKIYNALDVTTPFTGMATLFQLLTRDARLNTRVTYLSNAPETVAGIPAMLASHTAFLAFNNFPKGDVDLRESIFDRDHKINELRRLAREEKPDLMILFGDNGERDAEIYNRFYIEFGAKIRMVVFIHQLYASENATWIPDMLLELGKPIFKEQVGYVTAMEPALELLRRGILSRSSYDVMVKVVAPSIADESVWKIDRFHAVTFPYFMNCSEFVWRWRLTPEIQPVYQKIQDRCGR